MKRLLTSATIALTVLAASGVVAEEVKPVQPKASTQSEELILGGLPVVELTVIYTFLGLAGASLISGVGGGTNNTVQQ